MALATFTPPAAAGAYFNEGSEESHKPRVLSAGFGDGYAQEGADGLNADLLDLTPSWRNLTTTESTAVMSFFAVRKGYIPFLFTLPGESTARKFKATEWRRTWNAAGLADVSAVWKELAYPS